MKFLLVQFVRLGRDDQVRPLMRFEPFLEVQIRLHPPAANVHDYQGEFEARSLAQVSLNHRLPLPAYYSRNPGISITREIDKVKPTVDLIKIYGLRAARRIAGERQLSLPGESVDQAGFANITSPQKRNLRKRVGGELLGLGGTG